MIKSKKSSVAQWAWFFIGAMFVLLGAHKIITGEPGVRLGIDIPAWTGWFQLPFGLWAMFLSIRELRRSKKYPDLVVDIDEEAARAKEELDAMYLREHGELPQPPPDDEDEK